MGEIKSTLDIIMEKAKGLTVTEQEKEAFKKKEIEGKVKGLFQKLLDGAMDVERLKSEMAAFGAEQRGIAREALLSECLGSMNPQADNESILRVLEHVLDMDPAPFRRIIEEFHEDLQKEKGAREKAVIERLRKTGVSGTAVIPNINPDPEWGGYVAQAEEAFRRKLDSLGDKFLLSKFS